LVYAGRIPDPTGGATHFWTPKLRKKLDYKGPPGWAGKMKRTARIGEFVFHRHSGSGQRPLRLRKIT
jgi:spore germination cell wall hydrolase CwlJ-like protein